MATAAGKLAVVAPGVKTHDEAHFSLPGTESVVARRLSWPTAISLA